MLQDRAYTPIDCEDMCLIRVTHAHAKLDKRRYLATIQVIAFSGMGLLFTLLIQQDYYFEYPWQGIILGGFCVSLCVLLGCWILRSRSHTNIHAIDTHIYQSRNCPEESRLVCFGAQEELIQLSMLSKEFFEPIIICGASLGCTEKKQSILRLLLTIGIGMLFLMAVWHIVPFCIQWKLFAAIGIFLFIWLFTRYFQRAYFRVSPGLLEILHASWLGPSLKRIRAFDLTSAKVICDYRNQVLRIRDGSDYRSQEYRIYLTSVDYPHLLVASVYRAALSAKCAVKLPGDRLLG